MQDDNDYVGQAIAEDAADKAAAGVRKWQLVPVEPTRKMVRAAQDQEWTPDVYSAMLAAAPQPPALGGETELLGYVLTVNGKVHFEADDNVVISNVPGDEITEQHRWVPVVDRAHVAPLLAEIERLRSAPECFCVEHGLQIEMLKARNAELESGLRIIAVSAKGSTLGGLKMIAKQALNRTAALNPAEGRKS